MSTSPVSADAMTPVAEAALQGADWTIREIVQQPDVWAEVLEQIEARRDELEGWLKPLLDQRDLRIILTGAGTSAYAGQMLAPALTQRLGRRVEAIATTDIVGSPLQYLLPAVPTLLVSFARSGSSPESVAAVELAENLVGDCHHLILCCNSQSELAKIAKTAKDARCVFMPAAALDQSFAMTSSFTCMVVATLALLSSDAVQANHAIAAARSVLSLPSDLTASAVGDGLTRVAFLGSGTLQGLAVEAALKMLELSGGKTDCYSESALGFRHGPKFVVDGQTLVVLLTNSDPYTRKYDLDIADELERDGIARRVIRLERFIHQEDAQLSEEWLGLVYIVACQLLAYRNAVVLGNSPDNPCPSGEVNRVVQGVVVHPFAEAGL